MALRRVCERAVTSNFRFELQPILGFIPDMTPRFSEMNKVQVNDTKNEPYEGFVIASLFKDGRWIYKLSISEDPSTTESYDNWVPEEWLTLTK